MNFWPPAARRRQHA